MSAKNGYLFQSRGSAMPENILRQYRNTVPQPDYPMNNYREYAKNALLDYGPDPVLFDEEEPRRPNNSTQMVLRSRYSDDANPEFDTYPHHPEMFYGWTGNDTRDWSETPRMALMRRHVNARAPQIRARMKDSSDYSTSDPTIGRDGKLQGGGFTVQRGINGVELEKIRTGVQLRNSTLTKRFEIEKDGRPSGRSVIAMGNPRQKYGQDVLDFQLKGAMDSQLSSHSAQTPFKKNSTLRNLLTEKRKQGCNELEF